MHLQLVLNSCRFIVKLLCGVGDHLVPFIITDMSLKNVDVRNWSSKVRAVYLTSVNEHMFSPSCCCC